MFRIGIYGDIGLAHAIMVLRNRNIISLADSDQSSRADRVPEKSRLQDLRLMLNWVTSVFRGPPTEGQVVYFDLRSIDHVWGNSFGRQTYLLTMMFHENGYTVCFKPNFRFMAGFLRLKYKKLIHSFNPVFTFKKPQTAEFLYITDRTDSGIPGSVLLEYANDPASNNIQEQLPFPFLMHPFVYHFQVHKQVDRLRALPVSMRLFFGGNLDPLQYDLPEMQDIYGKLSRVKMIELLSRRLGPQYLRRIQDQEGLSRALHGKHGGFSWIANPQLKIGFADWLQVMAKCDFFLACPGVSKPICHNCVEAMAVGAIPVLEYPEYFHPPLIDGENCLVFSGEDDLVATVDQVFSLDEAAILKLKQGAIDYYESHLSPAAFGKNIANLQGGGQIAFMAHKIAAVSRL